MYSGYAPLSVRIVEMLTKPNGVREYAEVCVCVCVCRCVCLHLHGKSMYPYVYILLVYMLSTKVIVFFLIVYIRH